MMASRADEVVVHHQDIFLTDRLEFPHDIRNESLPVVGPAGSMNRMSQFCSLA